MSDNEKGTATNMHYMTDRDLQDFAARVNKELDRLGYPDKFHGRQTALGKALHADQKGVGRWLEGKGFPRANNLKSLAKHLGVSEAWLRYGQGPRVVNKINKDISSSPQSDNVSNITHVPSGDGHIPLIPLQDAMDDTQDFPLILSPLENTQGLIASVVEGSSMDGPQGYPNRSMIYWRRCNTAEAGDHVIAHTDDGVTVFRELDMDAGVRVLRPINNQYPIITGRFDIIGIIVCKSQGVQNSLER